jgi:hypothetical protein
LKGHPGNFYGGLAVKRLIFLLVLAFASPGTTGAKEVIPFWLISGPGKDQFTVDIDPTVAHSGVRSAKISGPQRQARGFVTILQKIRADDFHGKKAMLSAWVKTENVTGAHLWMRIDGQNGYLNMDSMEDRRIDGTIDWSPFRIVLTVPEEAYIINVGAVHQSDGTLWVDDFELVPASHEERVTNSLGVGVPFENQIKPRPSKHLPVFLENPSFEATD